MTDPTTLDLDAIRSKWTLVCPPCDAGYPSDCTHPAEDPRRVILDLLEAVRRGGRP